MILTGKGLSINISWIPACRHTGHSQGRLVYCKDLQLAIEIDGITHTWEEAPEKDAIRQERLESLGVRFLRFTDQEVKKEMSFVLNTIHDWIKEDEGLDW